MKSSALIEEIYFQPEFYNARLRATIPAAWIVTFESGESYPVCAGYEANNETEVLAILNKE